MVPSFQDEASEVNLNRIDPEAASTFIVYKGRVIIDTYENLEPNEADFRELTRKLR
jgi:hypothetical protein